MPAARWREGDSGTMKGEWVFSRFLFSTANSVLVDMSFIEWQFFLFFSSLKLYEPPWDHTQILK